MMINGCKHLWPLMDPGVQIWTPGLESSRETPTSQTPIRARMPNTAASTYMDGQTHTHKYPNTMEINLQPSDNRQHVCAHKLLKACPCQTPPSHPAPG